MFKTIKTVSFIIAISLAFATISCLNSEEDLQIQRTPEMEANELTVALNKLETVGYDIDTTELGIYYIVQAVGEGPLPQPGDTCYLEYSGYLMDGSIFDASQNHYADSIWDLIYKDVQLIPGFDDGIALMNKGAEIDMFIPSTLAYGPYGKGIIGPYATLVFSAKMHNIKPKAE